VLDTLQGKNNEFRVEAFQDIEESVKKSQKIMHELFKLRNDFRQEREYADAQLKRLVAQHVAEQKTQKERAQREMDGSNSLHAQQVAALQKQMDDDKSQHALEVASLRKQMDNDNSRHAQQVARLEEEKEEAKSEHSKQVARLKEQLAEDKFITVGSAFCLLLLLSFCGWLWRLFSPTSCCRLACSLQSLSTT
jgi:hypothetical protein